jgi:hypothetical protein
MWHHAFGGTLNTWRSGDDSRAVTARSLLRLAGVGPLATMVFYSVSTWAVVV